MFGKRVKELSFTSLAAVSLGLNLMVDNQGLPELKQVTGKVLYNKSSISPLNWERPFISDNE